MLQPFAGSMQYPLLKSCMMHAYCRKQFQTSKLLLICVQNSANHKSHPLGPALDWNWQSCRSVQVIDVVIRVLFISTLTAIDIVIQLICLCHAPLAGSTRQEYDFDPALAALKTIFWKHLFSQKTPVASYFGVQQSRVL